MDESVQDIQGNSKKQQNKRKQSSRNKSDDLKKLNYLGGQESQLPDILKSSLVTFEQFCTLYTMLSMLNSIVTLSKINISVMSSFGSEISVRDLALFNVIHQNLLSLKYVRKSYLESQLVEDSDIFKIKDVLTQEGEDQDKAELMIQFNSELVQESNVSKSFDQMRTTSLDNSDLQVKKRAGKRKTITGVKMRKLIDSRVKDYRERLLEFWKDNNQRLPDNFEILVSDQLPLELDQLNDIQAVDGNVSLNLALKSIISEFDQEQNFVAQLNIPERQAKYGSVNFSLHQNLEAAIKDLYNIKLSDLYSHQTQALDMILNKQQNVVVSTSTSSGKSMIFNIPVVHELLQTGNDHSHTASTALYLYPTKALAQDQLNKIKKLLDHCGLDQVNVSTYDGDTPQSERNDIKNSSQILITNPDMLHITLLPQHYTWKHFFQKLKYVIIDEVHMYTGFFGSHVSLILQRLKRIVNYHQGSLTELQFILCSATISNPLEHACNLINVSQEQMVCIDEDGSPHSSKDILVRKSNQNESVFSVASRMIVRFASMGVKLIAFCKYRKVCEYLLKEVNTLLETEFHHLSYLKQKIKTYRGGYQPELRRKIEKEFFTGQLLGVIATTALELGIDVGDLDVTLHVSFPYSLSGFWQQAGRAGRRKSKSASILLCGKDPIDYFYAANPNLLLEKQFADAFISPGQSPILDQQLQCAAIEVPLRILDDSMYFGKNLEKCCHQSLVKLNDRFATQPQYLPRPADIFPIRCPNQDTFSVVRLSDNEVLEELEASRAASTIFEGAVYLHEGKSYIVMYANFDTLQAGVQQAQVNYITQQRDYKDLVAGNVIDAINLANGNSACFGQVTSTKTIFGYYKYDPRSKKVIEEVDVYWDPVVSKHQGFWIKLSENFNKDNKFDKDQILAGIHSVGHIICNILPTFIICNQSDISTEHSSRFQIRDKPRTILIIDRSNSGFGYHAFKKISIILKRCFDIIESCSCKAGCPYCILSNYCTEFNEVIDKDCAKAILKNLVVK